MPKQTSQNSKDRRTQVCFEEHYVRREHTAIEHRRRYVRQLSRLDLESVSASDLSKCEVEQVETAPAAAEGHVRDRISFWRCAFRILVPTATPWYFRSCFHTIATGFAMIIDKSRVQSVFSHGQLYVAWSGAWCTARNCCLNLSSHMVSSTLLCHASAPLTA